MTITKFEHSCVLVEDGNFSFLVDPGIYAWNSGLVDVNKLPNLDAIIVTHVHGDHLAAPFVEALVSRFPDAKWFAPKDAHQQLSDYGVKNVANTSDDNFSVIEKEHAFVEPFGQQCLNILVNYQDKLSIVGDTLDIDNTNPVLLLPVQAPWGTTVNALTKAIELKPKFVIPVHDWMWNSEWKSNVYDRFEQKLAEQDITFYKAVNGEQIQINL